MRPLNIRVPKMRHICSIRGCGSKDTVMVARSSDFAGGIFVCRACAEEMYAHFNPMGDKADEVKQEAETAAEMPVEAPVVQSASKTATKKSTKSK
jgi:hypothetical protein